MSSWLAFDVGCIECGESSAVIGIFPSEEAAQRACDAAHEIQKADWRGQHSFVTFNISALLERQEPQ